MPDGGYLHINKVLTNVAAQYFQNNWLWKGLPMTPVKKETDLFYTFQRDFRIPVTARADGTPANQTSFQASTSSYALVEHALKDVATDRARANSDVIKLEKRIIEILIDQLARPEGTCHTPYARAKFIVARSPVDTGAHD